MQRNGVKNTLGRSSYHLTNQIIIKYSKFNARGFSYTWETYDNFTRDFLLRGTKYC